MWWKGWDLCYLPLPVQCSLAPSLGCCSEAVAGGGRVPVLGSLQGHDCSIALCRLSESHFHSCHFLTCQEMGCAFSRGLKPSCCISTVQLLF